MNSFKKICLIKIKTVANALHEQLITEGLSISQLNTIIKLIESKKIKLKEGESKILFYFEQKYYSFYLNNKHKFYNDAYSNSLSDEAKLHYYELLSLKQYCSHYFGEEEELVKEIEDLKKEF